MRLEGVEMAADEWWWNGGVKRTGGEEVRGNVDVDDGKIVLLLLLLVSEGLFKGPS